MSPEDLQQAIKEAKAHEHFEAYKKVEGFKAKRFAKKNPEEALARFYEWLARGKDQKKPSEKTTSSPASSSEKDAEKKEPKKDEEKKTKKAKKAKKSEATADPEKTSSPASEKEAEKKEPQKNEKKRKSEILALEDDPKKGRVSEQQNNDRKRKVEDEDSKPLRPLDSKAGCSLINT